MTFNDIKQVVKDYCNLTSTDADTRIGKAINRHYRRVTSLLGLNAARFVTRSKGTTIGQQTVVFDEIEKIDRILDATDATAINPLTEIGIDKQRITQPSTGQPTTWALQNTDADSVTVLLDTTSATSYSLQADGWTTLSDLSGTDEPVFPESFHDVLAWYVISEELLKKEKLNLSAEYKSKAEALLSDLRFHLADSPSYSTQQGASPLTPGTSSSAGGGSVVPTDYVKGGVNIADYADLAAALTAIGSNQRTLVIHQSTLVSTDTNIPANVAVLCLKDGAFSISSGKTLTISGSVIADRHQIFSGSGSVDLTDAKLDWVYPEWWGAVATKAASGTPADSTIAIDAAINSKRNVSLDQGIYGTTGGHVIQADGQKFRGQGYSIVADGQGGTILKRLSGTTTLLKAGSYLGLELESFVLDGNSLGGRLLQWQATYSRASQIGFRGVAGTSHALYLSACNFSKLTGLYFADGNYGHIQTDSANQCLYTEFDEVICGTSNGGYVLDCQNAARFVFTHFSNEYGPMRFGTNCRDIHFYHFTVESDSTADVMVTIDSTCWNVQFHGFAIAQNSGDAAANPFFDLTGCRGFVLENGSIQDLVSSGGRPWIRRDGALWSAFRNILAYSQNTCDLIHDVTTRSDDTIAENLNYHAGSAASCLWYVARLSVTGSNCPQSFSATGGSQHIAMRNVSGAITRTNVVGTLSVDPTSTSTGAVISIADGDTTPSVATGMNGAAFQFANSSGATVTAFDDGFDGQEINCFFSNGNTTFDFSSNANFQGNSGLDWTATSSDSLRAIRINGVWYCTVIGASAAPAPQYGTWTPADASGASLSLTVNTANCTYVKEGREVTVTYRITYPATADGTNAAIGGLPFTAENTPNSVYGGFIMQSSEATAVAVKVTTNTTTFGIQTAAGGGVTNATLSTDTIVGTFTYRTA